MRILMVDADPAVGSRLAVNLGRHSHEVRTVADGASALQDFPWADLILLETELPDIDGVEVCRQIRRICETQIIIVTTRGAEVDRVLGLQAGSDDYIVKPYSFPELVARIDAVMRRTLQPAAAGKQQIVNGPLRIDPTSREVRIADDLIPVTRKEFGLLYLLASRPHEVISRSEIMADIWDDDTCSSSSGRTVDTHVNTLRKKLGARDWIVTVRGVGFMMGATKPEPIVPPAVRPYAVRDVRSELPGAATG